MLCRFVAYAFGVITVIWSGSINPIILIIIIAALTLATEVLQWVSDRTKDIAEDLRRKLDLKDSFGWEITKQELADLSARRNEPVSSARVTEQYFASKKVPGPIRAAENIRETAWWSKQLASTAGRVTTVITVLLSGGALILLISSILLTTNIEAIRNVANTVISTLLLVFSLGLARRIEGYYTFSRDAGRVVEQANALLNSTDVREADAIKLAYIYFIARAKAPLIPGWIYGGISIRGRRIYNGQRDRLNEIWRHIYESNSAI